MRCLNIKLHITCDDVHFIFKNSKIFDMVTHLNFRIPRFHFHLWNTDTFYIFHILNRTYKSNMASRLAGLDAMNYIHSIQYQGKIRSSNLLRCAINVSRFT